MIIFKRLLNYSFITSEINIFHLYLGKNKTCEQFKVY